MQVEAELRDLDPAEAEEYLQSLGASEGGLTSLIKAAYRQLGLLTYFTTGAAPFTPHAWAYWPMQLGQCSVAVLLSILSRAHCIVLGFWDAFLGHLLSSSFKIARS